MGRRCSVPHCYTGYRKSKDRAEKETGSLFKVPDDDYFREQWNKAIAREDRLLGAKDFVCYKHFSRDDFIHKRFLKHAVEEYKVPKLKPDAIPSIFPELPDHIIKICKKRRKMPLPIKQEQETLIPEPEVQIKEELVEDEVESGIKTTEIEIKTEIQEEEEFIGVKIYKCVECDYKSTYKHNLQTHMTKHEKKCKYVCEKCPFFKTKWIETYKSHLRIKHDVGELKEYTCSLCTFKTKVQVCLKRHMDRHKKLLGMARYICQLCNFSTDVHKDYLQHKKMHKNNANFLLKDYHDFGILDVLLSEDLNEEFSEASTSNSIISSDSYHCKKCTFTSCTEENLQTHQKLKHCKMGAQQLLKCAECNFVSKTILCLKLHMKKHEADD
ncbi:unnamed protein product [Brassicogethes aeneus]|uniref:THAP-type domain-containing protein n=1 Tax=Brassicogethes aeneus TaxID=1431903 RepID=A0A9P0FD05_BRAAE|nr:unnamed protein product [Brassicogethes aeneus]